MKKPVNHGGSSSTTFPCKLLFHSSQTKQSSMYAINIGLMILSVVLTTYSSNGRFDDTVLAVVLADVRN